MKPTWIKNFFTRTLLTLAAVTMLLAGANNTLATTLSLGDLVFTGYQATAPDKVSFVLLKDISGTTIITVTDNAWTGTALATTEGNSVITISGSFSAGTQFNYDATRTTGVKWTVGTNTTGISESTGANFALNASGDNMFAYDGTNAPSTGGSAAWISAFASNPFLTTGSSTASLTYLPSAFTAGDTALSLGLANAAANENGAMTTPSSVTASAASIRSTVYTVGNWTTFTTAAAQAIPPSITFTVQSSTPTITGAATATAFTTTYGTASAAQNFSISGANLTANLVATATNTNFEVSSDGTNYGGTATFTQSGGTASGTLRIRVKATAAVGATLNSQNVVLSSTGATSVNIGSAASGNSVTAAALTITGLTGSNKTYNGNTSASFTGTPAYSGLQNSESFSVSGTAVATFATAAAGNSKTISITGYTAPSANYTLTQPSLTANINQANLTVTANNVNKAFGVALNSPGAGSVAFTSSGLVNSETIGSVTIYYTAGTNTTDAATTYSGAVTPSAATGGTFTAANYNITYVSGDLTVTASPTISGAATATAFTTTYGTASAVQTFTVSGANLTDDITATAPTGFEVANDGATYGATTTFTQSSGTASGTLSVRLKATAVVGGSYNAQNIALTSSGATTVNITTASTGNSVTAKALTISGLTGDYEKTYDGNTNAPFTGTAAYVGLENGESFSVTGTPVANFVTKTAGSSKTINVTGYTAPSGNYTVTQPTLTGNIGQLGLTITGATVTSKTYDGNNTATISLAAASTNTLISGDVVTISGGGTFADVNVANGIAVTAGLTLGGADGANYLLKQPSLTGNITQASQTITFAALADKTSTDADFALTATASSGNTVTFASTTPSVVTVSGNTVHIVGLGAASITASQAGSQNYAAATDVVRTFNVVAPSAHVVVLRIGNGSETLAANGNSVWMDQYDSSGTLAQSVLVPTNGANGILLSGGATSEGGLMRSPDGKYLCFPGYKTNFGTVTSVSGATSTAVPRSAVTFDGANNIAFNATTTSQYSGNNFRGAATDGAGNFWGAGAVSGTYYLGNGTAASVQTTTANTRLVNIFNGDLYLSTGSTSGNSGVGIYKFTGLPTASQAFSLVFLVGGTSPSPYGFAFNPTTNVCYVADDRANAAGGIIKYSYTSGAWVSNYTLATGVANIGARGVTVDWSGANPVIYATTAEATTNRLIKITDTGSASTATTLATAGTAKLFRGVAFAPVPAVTTQPSSTAVCNGSTATFTAAASGTPAPTAQWQLSTDNGATFSDISGATSTTTFSTNTVSAANGNKFRVVYNNLNGSVTSSVVTLTVNTTTASNVSYTFNQGVTLKLKVSNLLTNASGSGGVTLTSVSSTSASGTNLTVSGGYIYYSGPLAANDSFTYNVASVSGGCTASGTVSLVTANATGQTTGNITLLGGNANVTFFGIPGASYTIQVSTDLSSWSDVNTSTAGATGVITYTDNSPPTPAAFYRARYNP